MATDGTEISFVRCPSCRSLVPALSVRCRMCGATLEATAKVEEERDPRKASRVRQRTMSEPSADVSSALDRIRDEQSEVSAASPEVIAEPTRTERAERKSQPTMVTDAVSPELLEDNGARGGAADPLQAYIEEVETSEHGGPIAAPREVPPSGAADTPFQMGSPRSHTPTTEVNGTHAGAEEHESHRPIAVPESEPPPAGESEAPRVIVESGHRRNRGGLSFGRPREPVKSDTREMESAPTQRQSSSSSGSPAESRFDLRRQPPQEPRAPEAAERRAPDPTPRRESAPPPRRDQPPVSPQQPREAPRDNRGQRDRPTAPRPVEQAARPAPQAIRQERGSRPEFVPAVGRLAGWLVSYGSDPDGSAIELREGRFFVTGRSLKPHDLVLDNNTVSTPHALVIVDDSGTVRVQDLMSEHGISARRRGAEQYERCEEYSEFHHGDWIRFGEVEFLVSLVPYVGIK